MNPPSISDHGKNLEAGGTTTIAEINPTPQEDQLLQSITNLQSQLDVMSQRQDELIQLVGVLREPHQRSVSGGTAGGPPASNHDSSHTQEQLHMIQANHRPVSGHPATQQILPSQGQFRGPGQPILHSFDPNGRPLMHPIPPHPVPVFSQLHDRTGHVVGLVRRGSFSLSEPTGPGLGVRRVPPGWTQSPTHQPQVHPQMQSQARPRIPPRPIQQTPSQFNQQISSQITRQGSMPMNWSESPGPPPPYPGPIYLTPGEPTPRTNRVSRTFGTSTIPQPQTLPEEPNEGPEHDGNGLSVPPVPGRERMGNGPTRANPPRKARPKDLSELV